MARKRHRSSNPKRASESRAQSPSSSANNDSLTPSGRPPRSRRREWAFRFIAICVPPILVLGLIELALLIAGYGYPTGFFEPIDDTTDVATNPRFGWRFFPPEIARTPIAERISPETPNDTCRVFVLGGSAAQGVPNPTFGFPSLIEVMLRERYPGVEFEIINAAMTAINSHVVVTIADHCADFDPDVFIVYLGNNEVVGPYGPGTVFHGFSTGRSMIRTGIALRATRMGQLVDDLVRRAAGRPTELREWKGMQFFLDQQISADDPRLQTTYDHLRANLLDIADSAARADASVVFATVAVNLRDCPPFGSAHRANLGTDDLARWQALVDEGIEAQSTGDSATALAQFLAAEKIDNQYAALAYRIAQCQLTLDMPDAAAAQFVRARNLDTLRFRADSHINETIREVATQSVDPRIHFVDVAGACASPARSPYGIPGDELFYEHVHFRFAGNHVVAGALCDGMHDALPDWVQAKRIDKRLPDLETCAARRARTAWSRYTDAKDLLNIIERPPFTNQIGHERRLADFREHLAELHRAFMSEDAQAAAVRQFREHLTLRPNDLMVRDDFAHMLEELGQHDAAVDQLQFLVRRVPGRADWRASIAYNLIAAGNVEAGNTHYAKALELTANQAELYHDWAVALMSQNQLLDALDKINHAIRLAQGTTKYHFSRGNLFARLKRLPQAVTELETALQLDPNHPEAHHNLGVILLQLDRDADAAAHFEKMLDLQPDSLPTLLQLGGMYAMHPDASLRDGHRALELAHRACDLTGRAEPFPLDLLAAAHAELGQFSEALEAAHRAYIIAREQGNEQLATMIQQRAALYQRRQPFHGFK